MTTPPSTELRFTRYDVRDLGSLSSVFATTPASARCGIYVLEFADGAEYVGQAHDVVSRFATHRRRWADIQAVRFAPCEPTQLDTYERSVIHERESSVALRNVLLTHRPRGWQTLSLKQADGTAPLLPESRADRPMPYDVPVGGRIDRYWRLRARPDYPAIQSLLAEYVTQTIADAGTTIGNLWTLTALPGTGYNRDAFRLFTLNCGAMESLYAYDTRCDDGSRAPVIAMNLFREAANAMPPQAIAHIDIYDAPYKSLPTKQIRMESWDEFANILAIPVVLDAAYSLNTRLMLRGHRHFNHVHNAAFAWDVLTTAAASNPTLEA